jgi:hypothetical protein
MPVSVLFFQPVNFPLPAWFRNFSHFVGMVCGRRGWLSASAQLADDTDGKVRGRIICKLDGSGRYESGQVFAANGALRFKTLYQYDTASRPAKETHVARDGSVRNRNRL